MTDDVEEVAAAREQDQPEQPAPEAPAALASGGAPPGIKWNDRVLVIGQTGSGKSVLLDHLFGQFDCQRLLVDTKDEFTVADVEPVRDVAAIDWRQPIIHYIDRTGEVPEFEGLFAACHQRRHLIVRADELTDLCEYQPNKAPTSLRKFYAKGRAHGQGMHAGTQRPVLIPTAGKSEAQHVFIFAPRLSPADHVEVSKIVGMHPDKLAAHIDGLPEHGFLWWQRTPPPGHLSICNPLPDHVRKQSIVTRRTVA